MKEFDVSNAKEILVEALKEHRPLVAILGQDSLVGNDDPLLRRAREHLGISHDSHTGWNGVLQGSTLSGDFYEWLAERYKGRAHNQSLAALGLLPISAIFTSALDPTLIELFATPRREPQAVLTANESPIAVRSLVRPPVYYLFSRAGELDPQAQPPSDLITLNSRRAQHTLPLLNLILDTATAIGVVVVDGYSPTNDWLRIDDLLGALGNANRQQVLWFGGYPQLDGTEAALFAAAINSGRILIDSERLSDLIAELQYSGRLEDLRPPESEDAGVITFANGTQLETKPEERLRVEAVTSIVDDSWTAFLPPLGPDAEYSMFRHFHGASEGPRLLVEGIRREFAIERNFEAQLQKLVDGAISNHASVNAPLIVKGQSGTGKSVALARVVANVRREQSAAVLYSIGRIPQPQDVSDFCERAEEAGARVTLIVCDANREVDRYHDLLVGLRSRGRRIVLLGSQYLTEESSSLPKDFAVDAPAVLSSTELDSLKEILQRFISVGDASVEDSQNILAFLYRVLPPSRERIRTGLGDEARSTEQLLRRRGNQPVQVRPLTEMHVALMRSGLIEDYRPLFDDDEASALEYGEHTAGKVIDLVMVAGALNCPVPLNLLLRAVKLHYGDFDYTGISELFRGLDLFRWQNDPQENDLLLAPRLTLEAQLICQRRLGSIEAEADRLLELINSVRPGIERVQETFFLLNLLQQIGNDGPRGDRYKSFYTDFGRALTDLRMRNGLTDARLMLQESAFRRSAVRHNMLGNL